MKDIGQAKIFSTLKAIWASASGEFNPVWYLETYQDVKTRPRLHFFLHGRFEGRKPNPRFCPYSYLGCNPDLRASLSVAEAFTHYIWFGARERRLIVKPNSPPPSPKQKIRSSESKFEFNTGRYHQEVLRYESERSEINSIACVTAITGGYENYCPPQILNPAIDYYCITDSVELSVPRPVKKIIIQPLSSDPTRTARAVKIKPLDYLPKYYTKVAWVDGNVIIKSCLSTLIKALDAANSPIGLIRHPLRTNIRDEVVECIMRGKEDPKTLESQLDRLSKTIDLDEVENAIGLFETNFILYNFQIGGAAEIGDAWFKELFLGSKRDQIALPIALHQTGVPFTLLGKAEDTLPRYNNVDFAFIEKHIEKPVNFDADDPILFPNPPLEAAKTATIPEPTDASIKLSIVVPVHNALKEFAELKESLCRQQGVDLFQLEVIMVDDASTPALEATDLSNTFGAHKFIRNETNLGYTKSVNLGIKNCSGDAVVILNSDTILPTSFLNKISEILRRHNKLHLLGPLSNAASFQSIPHLDGTGTLNVRPSGITLEDLQNRLSQEVANNKIPELLHTSLLNGFCLIVRKEVFQAIGLFDELRFPQGYGEEDDFLIRAQLAGFNSAITPSLYVHHHKSRSFGSSRRKELVARGKEQLEATYGTHLIDRLVKDSKKNKSLELLRGKIESFYHHSLGASSLLDTQGADFLDVGCGIGSSMDYFSKFTGTPKLGFGIDTDVDKVRACRANGKAAAVANFLEIAPLTPISFCAYSHVLEHLDSQHTVSSFIEKGLRVSRDFIVIRQPFFDHAEYLEKLGVKYYWSDWTGHTCHITTQEVIRLLQTTDIQNLRGDMALGFKKPITTTDDPSLLPLGSCSDSHHYDASLHPPKPPKVLLSERCFQELLVVVTKKGSATDPLAILSKMRPDFLHGSS